MDLHRVAHPLGAVLRGLLAVVIVAALVVDGWTIEGQSTSKAYAAVLVIGAIGVVWTRWPSLTLPLAVSSAFLSVLITANMSRYGLRIVLFTEFVVLPLLFGATLAGRAISRWPVAAAVAVAGESIALRVHDNAIRGIIAISMLVLLGAATTAVVYIRLRDSERRTSIEQARHNERLDLARELHDVLGHHVTGIVVLAQASRFTHGREIGPEADQAFADIEAAGLETLTSVRRLIGLLRTEPSATTGPRRTDVEKLIEELRSTHPSTDLHIDEEVRAHWVPPELATTVQRLVQEAATNVRRHGDPHGDVRFVMRRIGSAFDLTIENRVLTTTVTKGYGLIGMRERVDALHGSFSAESTADGRWTVHVSLPLEAAWSDPREVRS